LPNSRGAAEALQSIYHVKSDFIPVKNPTDIEKIKKLAAIPLEENIRFDKFTFIHVGTFRDEKNQDLIVEALPGIRELNFQLIMVGKGEGLDRFKHKVQALGFDENVIFINFTENPYQYMARSNCFLLTSLTEGFPNVLIESMVCGLPIISVDCKTGPREILAPSTSLSTVIPPGKFEIAEYGILSVNNSTESLAAAMKWALENPGQLNAYKEKGIEKANAFEIKKVCNEFSEIFDRYLKN
jgi:N-acetylgalactosamine-N,N'-diacetylbacillosaminyl-diphospho-undecaprenol 4-alpha-N-acetylgalactosaminyltransferase